VTDDEASPREARGCARAGGCSFSVLEAIELEAKKHPDDLDPPNLYDIYYFFPNIVADAKYDN
jgi:hypothetical protein